MERHDAPLMAPLVAVSVGEPAPLGTHRGRPVTSGFRKRPATEAVLRLTALNLAGDRQADLSVHGGPEKAVYAYSADHFFGWRAQLGVEVGPAYFGENLTVSGWTETDARIGDVWAWGDARLQVCQPRWPCYKLAIASGLPKIGKLMLANGWTGWYFRVLQVGDVPVAGPIEVVERGPCDCTVHDAHLAMLPNADPALVARIAANPALAASWRDGLR
ncbi:MAG: MOSC domain-containing protein [Thermomicrobiales bacterium]